MFMPPFCFWGSQRTVPQPAQLSFDLAFGVAPVTAGSSSLQTRFDLPLAVLHRGNECAAVCVPLVCTRASLSQTLPLVQQHLRADPTGFLCIEGLFSHSAADGSCLRLSITSFKSHPIAFTPFP